MKALGKLYAHFSALTCYLQSPFLLAVRLYWGFRSSNSLLRQLEYPISNRECRLYFEPGTGGWHLVDRGIRIQANRFVAGLRYGSCILDRRPRSTLFDLLGSREILWG
jgi:hypothetical protein